MVKGRKDFFAPSHKRIPAPSRTDRLVLRLLTMGGLLTIANFLIWFFQGGHAGHPLLYGLLLVSLGYKLLHLLYEWFYLASLKVNPTPPLEQSYTVDMLTTHVPGEPIDMVIQTLQAMVAVRYPHNTILCDEGNDPRLRQACEALGVTHIYRGADKQGAKAGNINYALRHHARGEIVVILDPDHVPVPEFLDRVLPYFQKPQVGFVQCIQAYGNINESFVARGAAEQTFGFYGPLMMGMNRHGTVQAIGANCSFRRKALDEIGGHATGLCEDMHTSMQLHAGKWTSIYVPEALTRGRVPATLSAYYKQQLKWTKGCFDLLLRVYPKLFRKLRWRQRIHYLLTPLYFLYGPIGLIDIGVPAAALTLGHVPLYIDMEELIVMAFPMVLGVIVIRHYAQKFVLDLHERGFHFIGGVLRFGTWHIYLRGLVKALLNRPLKYDPTPKEFHSINEWRAARPNLVMLLISLLAVGFGLNYDWTPFSWIMAGFALFNSALLGLVVIMGQQRALSPALTSAKNGRLRWYARQWFLFRHHLIYPLSRHPLALLFFILSTGWYTLEIGRAVGSEEFEVGEEVAGFLSEEAMAPDWQWSEQALSGLQKQLTAPERQPKFAIIPGLVPTSLQIGNIAGYNAIVPLLDTCAQMGRIPLLVWEADGPGSSERFLSDSAHLKSLAADLRAWQGPAILFLPGISEKEDLKKIAKAKALFLEAGATNLSWALEPPATNDSAPGKWHPADIFLFDHSPAEWNEFVQVRDRDSLARPIMWPDMESLQLATWQDTALSFGQTMAFKLIHNCSNGQISGHQGSKAEMAFVHGARRERSLKHRDKSETLGNEPQIELSLAEDGLVRGICYNPEQDWRDGHWPLSRKQLEKDFDLLVAMGANTIQRDRPTVYDQNIFATAQEKGLKVIYGFPFDPSIDYARAHEHNRKIKADVLAKVHQWMKAPALSAWKLGDGTWDAMSEHFAPPYLTEVRLAYARLIGDISREIKGADADHPVLAGLNAKSGLFGAIDDFSNFAPELDGWTVNAYSPATLAQLLAKTQSGVVDQPLLVTGLGPYQSIRYEEDLQLIEPSCLEKARAYTHTWRRLFDHAHPRIQGGVAYCWRDRMDGTATLWGLTDYKGRLKPAYFALKELWTGRAEPDLLADLRLESYRLGNDRYQIDLRYEGPIDVDFDLEWIVRHGEDHKPLYKMNSQTVSEPSFWQLLLARATWSFPALDTDLFDGPLTTNSWGTRVLYSPESPQPMSRIYVYLTDGKGRVVTASAPVAPYAP